MTTATTTSPAAPIVHAAGWKMGDFNRLWRGFSYLQEPMRRVATRLTTVASLGGAIWNDGGRILQRLHRPKQNSKRWMLI